MKTALITGVTGQDGSYLAEHLLELGYRVVGMSRRASSPNTHRIRHLMGNACFYLVSGDVTDPLCVYRLIKDECPDEVYNLAAQSHVGNSFVEPSHTTAVTYGGCLNLLEAIRTLPKSFRPRFYQASSSEMFGTSFSSRWRPTGFLPQFWELRDPLQCGGLVTGERFQYEATPMLPCSPYAIAKLAAHHAVRLYREAHGVFACSGVLFNHESPRRGPEFVTRKITRWCAEKVRDRSIPPLRLGNLDASRDWGHARDYVRAMHLMLQHEQPDDYVIATGETHTVREFVSRAFALVGADPEKDVVIDPAFYRPSEVPYLRGDATKARNALGWTLSCSFDDLVREMVYADIAEVCGDSALLSLGAA